MVNIKFCVVFNSCLSPQHYTDMTLRPSFSQTLE